jgi:hypothetical protein
MDLTGRAPVADHRVGRGGEDVGGDSLPADAGRERAGARAGGIPQLVLVMCLLVGAYFTWFGYVASDAKPPTRDGGSGHFRSKRSSSITFVHAAMKSVTNFFLASAPA